MSQNNNQFSEKTFKQFLNSILAPTVFKICPKIQIKIFLLVVTVSVCDMPKIVERMKRLPALSLSRAGQGKHLENIKYFT